MKKQKSKKLFLTIMLIVAMALSVTGCKNKAVNPATEQTQSNSTIIGEGKTVIQFVVVDQDGKETNFEIHTDKETVGDALLEHNLIAGDEGDFGLYVKQVNGITADYDVDKTYWAFYINGEYAPTGVDSTAVKEGETYTLKIEK